MTPLQTILQWLDLHQHLIERDDRQVSVVIYHARKRWTGSGRSLEDLLQEAYEELVLEPGRREMAADERERLPDYSHNQE